MKIFHQVTRSGNVTVVEQKEKKDTFFQDDIFNLCIECVSKGEVPDVEVTLCIEYIYLVTCYIDSVSTLVCEKNPFILFIF